MAAVSGNSCCLDTRIGASAPLAGYQGGLFPGVWFQPDASPQLFLHGTADRDVPFSFSQKLYDDTRSSKLFVSITGGAHLDPFVTGSQRPTIVKLILDFFRANLQGDTAAGSRIPADANVEGVLKLEASAGVAPLRRERVKRRSEAICAEELARLEKVVTIPRSG